MSIRARCRILRAQKKSFCFFSLRQYDGCEGETRWMGAIIRMFVRVDGVGLRSYLRLWDPLALYVCPRWIHGQRTKEAILLNDDNTITINAVTPRRQDTTKQPAVGGVKSDDRWETRTCIAANNSLEVIWSFSPPHVLTSCRLGADFCKRKDAQLCTPCSCSADKFRTGTHRAHCQNYNVRWDPAAD